MSNIFLTSDTHFGHSKPFIYEPRGFKNIYEHDKTIIKNWNNVVNYDDEVFHLGDVMLNDNNYGLSCLKQLNGQIHIIRGNHCSDTRKELYKSCHNVVEVCDGKFFRYGKYHFMLSHYPSLTANHDEDKPLKTKMVNLCGHTHTKNPFYDWDKGVIYHVELDAHNCQVVNIEHIISDIKNKLKENIE